MRVNELFEMRPGVTASRLDVQETASAWAPVPLMRPSHSFLRTIAGYIAEDAVEAESVMPAETLFVSTDGEGSHTYAYVSPVRFVPNSNVTVLLPLRPMSLEEKLYYARCITLNRPRFSYGRKPKGERLAKVELPPRVPTWLKDVKVPIIIKTKGALCATVPTDAWRAFRYADIFAIARGEGPSLAEAKDNPGTTPYVTASARNNGISAWTTAKARHPAACISVAIDGSVGEAFFQPNAFCANTAVVALVPRLNISREALLFIATLIRREGKLKYGYGRKWGLQRMAESTVRLPSTSATEPDFAAMERLIRDLPSYQLLSTGLPAPA